MSTENVLQGILSQKIVQDGGGYAARTDIVNVDNITATSINATSMIANNFRSTSAAGPHFSTAGNLLKVSTTTAANTAGTFDLNGNNLIDSGGNRQRPADPAGSDWAPYITLGSDINTNGRIITDRNGAVGFGTNIDLQGRDVNNVDQLRFANDSEIAISTQVGQITSSASNTITESSSITGVSAQSLVLITPTSDPEASRYWVTTATGKIQINVNPAKAITFNYFILRY